MSNFDTYNSSALGNTFKTNYNTYKIIHSPILDNIASQFDWLSKMTDKPIISNMSNISALTSTLNGLSLSMEPVFKNSNNWVKSLEPLSIGTPFQLKNEYMREVRGLSRLVENIKYQDEFLNSFTVKFSKQYLQLNFSDQIAIAKYLVENRSDEIAEKESGAQYIEMSSESKQELEKELEQTFKLKNNGIESIESFLAKCKQRSPELYGIVVAIVVGLFVHIISICLPQINVREQPSAPIVQQINIIQVNGIMGESKYYHEVTYYDLDSQTSKTGWVSKRALNPYIEMDKIEED